MTEQKVLHFTKEYYSDFQEHLNNGWKVVHLAGGGVRDSTYGTTVYYCAVVERPIQSMGGPYR